MSFYKASCFLLVGLVSFFLQAEPVDDFSKKSSKQGLSQHDSLKDDFPKDSLEFTHTKNNFFFLPESARSLTLSKNILYESQQLNEFYNLNPTFSIPSIRQSVFKIRNKIYPEGLGSSGTTFYIGDNRFVTNFHIFPRPFLPESRVAQTLFLYYGGKEIPFQKVLALDYKNDLTVLELNQKAFKEIESRLVPLQLSSVSKFSSLKKRFCLQFS